MYRFEVRIDGRLTNEVSISADISIFRARGIGLQEGPLLSEKRLMADLERGCEGEHELTAADVQAFADTKALAEAEHAASRKAHGRWPGVQAETQQKSP